MVITGLVVLAGPVYMRNVLLSGDHVLIASQGGVNLYLGNNSIADGISPRLPEPWGANWRLDDMVFEAERDEGRELSPGEVSAWWRNEALGWMVDNPGRAGRLFLHKLYFTIGNREVSNNRDLPRFIRSVPILRLIPLGFATVFAFAALGCWAGWRSAEVRLIAAIVIAMTLVTAVFFFASRFRLPLLPYYFVLAASGALFLLRRLMERPRAAVAPVGLVLLIWLFSYLPMVSLPPGPVVTGLLSKGLSHYHQGNFAEAARWFEAARAADTTYPEASLNLAACRIQQGRADEARSLLRTEIALHPKRAKAYTNLASLELAAGRAASAAAWAEQAIDRRPHDREANRVWLRASEQDSAISDSILLKRVERSAYNTSDHQLVLYEGALLLSERGRYRAALGWLQRATESGPPPIEMDDAAFDPDFANHPARLAHRQGLILYQMGFLSGLTGDVSGAVTYSSRAIAADSGIVGAYINLAGGLAAQSRLDEAERIVRLARQRFPDDSLIQSLGR